jgi:hypothetical protein
MNFRAGSANRSIDPQTAADFIKRTFQRDCRDRTQKEREHFARVCRDYLTASFEARIRRAQERHRKLGAQTSKSPEFKLAFDEAGKMVADLQRDKADHLAGLERLSLARPGPVQHLGTALVLTADAGVEAQLGAFARETDDELRRRKEKKAEELAIKSLIAEGFLPENFERVAQQKKLGFDFRAHRLKDPATGEIEARRIEVKGYASGTPIQMEVSEWYRAQQLKETYWLYVAWDPLTNDAEPIRIQDPATKLEHTAKEVVKTRVFVIPAEAINQHAQASPPSSARVS